MTQIYRAPSFGLSGDGTPHLPPQEGRAVYYEHGPFAARLAPSMIQKMLGEDPGELWLGLFVRPPNADGDQYEEVVAEDYSRVAVGLGPYGGGLDGNVQPLAFHLAAGVPAKWVGLFDGEGRLRFYGFLSGYQKRPELPRSFEFAAFDLKVKRFTAPPTGGPRPQLGGSAEPRT